MRRALVLTLTTLCAFGALQLPANASYEKCNTYDTLDPNGTATEAKVCVNVSGSQRGGYLYAWQSGYGSIYVQISSLYVRQCDAYGHNCIVIAQNGGVAGGGTDTSFIGDLKPVSFGHTYIACASMTINNDTYTNVCSNFWAN